MGENWFPIDSSAEFRDILALFLLTFLDLFKIYLRQLP